jgi:NADH-quinone oxidoreductase subunit G
MRANLSVHEPKASQDSDSALAFSMEGYMGPNEDASFVPFAWAPGWNSPQAWTKFQDEVGGHLRSGDSGVRMIAPSLDKTAVYYSNVPSAFAAQADQWTVLPLYHLFGSDELSVQSPAVQSMVVGAYVLLHSADAGKLGLKENANVRVIMGDRVLSLRLKLSETLTSGCVGLPVGVSAMPPLLGVPSATISRLEAV